MEKSALEAELKPYQFLETSYNKAAFTLTNDKTTASCIGTCGVACLAMTRPIGRDHRLILKIEGFEFDLISFDAWICFTTCDTADLANDRHLSNWCDKGCTDRLATGRKTMTLGSQATIRRTPDNRIEVVVSDANGLSSTEHWDMDVTADVPVVPLVFVFSKSRRNIQILPDEEGLQIVRSQIDALQAATQKRHEVLSAVVANWNDLRSVVQSTANKLDQQINQQNQMGADSRICCRPDEVTDSKPK